MRNHSLSFVFVYMKLEWGGLLPHFIVAELILNE